jgi:type IV secretion system protein VirD4
MPDEVRAMKKSDAILLISGEPPVMDKKYDIMRHPNVARTPDTDKSLAYKHGEAELALCGISLNGAVTKTDAQYMEIPAGTPEIEILTEYQVEKMYNEKGNETNEQERYEEMYRSDSNGQEGNDDAGPAADYPSEPWDKRTAEREEKD